MNSYVARPFANRGMITISITERPGRPSRHFPAGSRGSTNPSAVPRTICAASSRAA